MGTKFGYLGQKKVDALNGTKLRLQYGIDL
jgi:hypothetical protein